MLDVRMDVVCGPDRSMGGGEGKVVSRLADIRPKDVRRMGRTSERFCMHEGCTGILKG
jgi:hypothetical protein